MIIYRKIYMTYILRNYAYILYNLVINTILDIIFTCVAST